MFSLSWHNSCTTKCPEIASVATIPLVGKQTRPAGWYPDPAGGPHRRYWDGQDWTDERAEPEIPEDSTSRIPDYITVGSFLVVGFVMLLGAGKAVEKGRIGGAVLSGLVGLAFAVAAWPVWLAFRAHEKRRKRQQASDRARALAINAEREDQAYLQGDDHFGVYGQFPPPPEILEERDR